MNKREEIINKLELLVAELTTIEGFDDAIINNEIGVAELASIVEDRIKNKIFFLLAKRYRPQGQGCEVK